MTRLQPIEEGAAGCESNGRNAGNLCLGRWVMSVTPVERVRHAVIEHLARLSGDPLASPCESILIRNGLYCGRKFQWQGYEVVWFLEEDQIKFFGPCGNLLYSSTIISFLQVVEDHVAQVGNCDELADRECADRNNRFAA